MGFAQGADTTVTVSFANGQKTTVSQATITVYSTAGYFMGGAYQALSGVLITDPVIAPPGVTLTATLVPWSKIAKLDWGPWKEPMPPGSAEDAITYVDGTTAKVFLLKAGREGKNERLSASDFYIKGQVALQGKSYAGEVFKQQFNSLSFVRQ